MKKHFSFFKLNLVMFEKKFTRRLRKDNLDRHPNVRTFMEEEWWRRLSGGWKAVHLKCMVFVEWTGWLVRPVLRWVCGQGSSCPCAPCAPSSSPSPIHSLTHRQHSLGLRWKHQQTHLKFAKFPNVLLKLFSVVFGTRLPHQLFNFRLFVCMVVTFLRAVFPMYLILTASSSIPIRVELLFDFMWSKERGKEKGDKTLGRVFSKSGN